jgi:hypothetical protein
MLDSLEQNVPTGAKGFSQAGRARLTGITTVLGKEGPLIISFHCGVNALKSDWPQLDRQPTTDSAVSGGTVYSQAGTPKTWFRLRGGSLLPRIQ